MNYIIVTNTINRGPELVARSLRCSLGQKIKPVKVILIDQNREPLPLPDDILNNPLFERQRTVFKSVSAARNSLKIPDGTEWIFFCDDDGYPDENYSLILCELIKERWQILAGSIIRDDTHEYYTLRHKKGGSLKKFTDTKNMMGSNFVVMAEIFNKLGRFDENFGAGSYWGSGEETDFCWKAFFGGVKMEYFPELKVYHVPPFNESVKQGFRKSYRYGKGKGALVWKWMIRNKETVVLYEFLEMLVVPLIQIVRGIVTFKFQLSVNNIAVLYGRIYGFFKAPFVKFRNT